MTTKPMGSSMTDDIEMTFDAALDVYRTMVLTQWDQLPDWVCRTMVRESFATAQRGKHIDGHDLTPEQIAIYQEIADFGKSKGVVLNDA
jgi:hypothetical protein